MMSVQEVKDWLDTIDEAEFKFIAIDDGGLALVEMASSTQQGSAYLEVGGIPLDEPIEESLHPLFVENNKIMDKLTYKQ